jgi:hypothetical protein
MLMRGSCNKYRGTKNEYKILVGKLEWEKNGRHCHRWEQDIEMDLERSVDWIHLAQNMNKLRSLVNTATNLCV